MRTFLLECGNKLLLLFLLFLLACQRKPLSLQVCAQDPTCKTWIADDIWRLYDINYRERKGLFRDETAFWTWEILNPRICQSYYQIPIQAQQRSFFDKGFREVGMKWSLLSSSSGDVILAEGKFYTTSRFLSVVNRSLQTIVRGCHIWILAFPDPNTFLGIGPIRFSRPSLRLRHLQWVCEQWLLDLNALSERRPFQEVLQEQKQRTDNLRQLLTRDPLAVSKQQLSQCDWFLWCEMNGPCTTGGTRFSLSLPSIEEFKR